MNISSIVLSTGHLFPGIEDLATLKASFSSRARATGYVLSQFNRKAAKNVKYRALFCPSKLKQDIWHLEQGMAIQWITVVALATRYDQYILTQKSSYTWNIVCFHGYYRSKKLGFSFLQERVSIYLYYSPLWFDFLKLSMVQQCLKHPKGHLLFLQNKIFYIAGFKCVKTYLQRIIFPNCLTLHWIRHFWCHIKKQFGRFGRFRYKN